MKFDPAVTVSGFAVLVTPRSACVPVPTVVTAVALLFARLGSFVPDVTLSTSTICVPLVVPLPTCTTTVKLTVPALLEKSGFVHVILPVPPTAGVVQVQPATVLMDWKVVFAGMPSLNTTLTASNGPLFVTVWVYVMFPPGSTTGGVAELVTARSAPAQYAPACVPGVSVMMSAVTTIPAWPGVAP